MHALGPAPEQLPQLTSHVWHPPVALSKNWFCAHVFKHLPLLSTGLLVGHVEH